MAGAAAMPLSVAEPRRIVQQIRRLMDAAELDCTCRGALDEALERLSAFEARRLRTATLREGQRAKARISMLLSFLGELEEVTVTEADASVFGELADLFETIAQEAAAGAQALRQLEDW